MNELDKLVQCSKNDEKSFEKLLQFFEVSLKYNCKKVLKYCPALDFDELMQMGRIGLMEAVKYYDTSRGCSFKNFADMCIYRKMLKVLREHNKNTYSKKKMRIISIDDPITYSGELCFCDVIAVENYNVNDNVVSNIILQQVNNMLDKDSLEYKILVLKLQGRSYSEISRLLNIPLKQVDYILQKIKKKAASKVD